MNRTNKIISIAILALGLGVMPQAQGMGYFKSAYHSACSWGKKAVNSALVVKSQAMARIAMIANHIAPTKKSDKSPEITQNHNALKRAQMIVNHLAPTTLEDTIIINKTHGSDTAKPDILEFDKNTPAKMVEGYLTWFYGAKAEDVLSLTGDEVGREEIFDTADNLMGHIIYYLKDEDDSKQVFARFVNNDNVLLGFCVAKINSKKNEGYISFLHVNQTIRQGGYGKILLAYTTKKLYEFNCKTITGRASSFDLKTGENQEHMQTKLEGFYGQFGAESLDGTKAKLGLSLL